MWKTRVQQSSALQLQAQQASAPEDSVVNRYELTEVFCADGPQVDIVLVHGLNGHPQKTWTAKNDVFWPAELLPASLGAVPSRILVYGYNADVYAFGGKSATSDYIHDHAQTLITTLDADRLFADATYRPIIFVAHSLGGILVKRALVYSASITNDNTRDLRSIYLSTYGIIFLGTPHLGAEPAKWGIMLQSMCSALFPRKLLDTEPQLVTALKTQSETLQSINISFLEIMERFHMCLFHEAAKTDLGVTQEYVVDQSSAAPPWPGATYAGIPATHSDMCKFESKRSPGYTAVAANLKRYSQSAPDKVVANWSQEHMTQEQTKKLHAMQLLGPTHPHGPMRSPSSNTSDQIPVGFPSPDNLSTRSLVPGDGVVSRTQSPELPVDPILVAPDGFRENKLFYGMQHELKEIHEKLFDAETRSRGSACVLLWCLPGGGKSHLARQYLYSHRDAFPGGIFWIRARYKEEIAQDFWEIAQKVALKDVKDPRTTDYEQEKEKFIRVVKSWFEAREGWLLIFDGLAIDSEADKTAWQAYLPDSKNSSIILTSVNRSLAGSHRLLNPVAVKVMALAEKDARNLLLRELGREHPSNEELQKASEIVKKVDRLPLAIHAIGSRLRETKEPLVKYHVRPYEGESKLREPFLDIMQDLDRFNHVEARNLIYLLCFFGRQTPFEMIHLGINSLQREGVNIRARENGGRPDLNTTLGILIRYALVERNDPDDASSQGSHPSLINSIDVLKMHTVVQNFLCDELRSANLFPQWLTYAVSLFIESFSEADHRMKNYEAGGLARDYREYEVHGKRIMQHINRNRTRWTVLEPVATRLEGILERVQNAIRKQTPESSQEAVYGQAGQLSVFDRTSSTSDTGPETPGREASITPVWPCKTQNHSPVDVNEPWATAEIGTLAPIPLYALDDDGYRSEIDQPGKPTIPKNNQVQGHSTGPRNLTSHRTVVNMKKRRLLKTDGRLQLFDSKTTEPQVSRITAKRSNKSKLPASLTNSGTGAPDALTTLKTVQQKKPPLVPSEGLRRVPSFAKLERASQSATRAELYTSRQALPTVMARNVAYPPSPTLLDSYVPRSNHHTLYGRSHISGLEDNGIAIERLSMSVGSQARIDSSNIGSPDSADQHYQMNSSTSMLPPASDYTLASYQIPGLRGAPTTANDLPWYGSEPLSRNGSGQSATGALSVTGTEPSRFPPAFSPSSGLSPVFSQVRVMDASRFRIPQNVHTSNLPEAATLEKATPRYVAEQDLAALGHWSSLPAVPTMTTVADLDPRPGSEGGPGIRIEGMLTRFGEHDQVPFSVSSPPNITRPGSAPYPTVSQMPESDGGLQHSALSLGGGDPGITGQVNNIITSTGQRR